MPCSKENFLWAQEPQVPLRPETNPRRWLMASTFTAGENWKQGSKHFPRMMGCCTKAAAKHCGDCPQNQCDVRRGAHTAPGWYHSTHGHTTLAGTLLHPPALPGNRVRDSKTSAKTGPFSNACSCPFRGAASLRSWLAKLSEARPHIFWGSPGPVPGQGFGEPPSRASKRLHRRIANTLEQRGGIGVGREEKQKKTPRPGNKTPAQRHQAQWWRLTSVS